MAGKRKIPEPTIPKGKNTYTFFFYNSKEKRKQFYTGTDSLREAKKLAEHIHELYNLSDNDERALELDDQAYEEYFNHSKWAKPQKTDKILLTYEDMEIIDKYIPNHEFNFRFIKALHHYTSLANEVDALREQLTDYNELKDSMLAQQARAISLCPAYSDAFEVFLEEYAPTVTLKQAQDVIRVNEAFIEYTENQKPASITISQIRDFLNKESRDRPDPDTRRKKVAALLSTFFYKAAERYNFPCQFTNMSTIRSAGKKKRKIIWYDLPEMEEIIQGLNPYWSALVATMCYAGIGIKELRGIRNEDFVKVVQININGQAENKYYLNIEPHLDRTLKNKNRDELVPVDPVYLLPHLEKLFQLKLNGKKYIFEKPADMRRIKPGNDVWDDSHLSKKMNGDNPKYDKSGKKIRSGCIGILPKGYKVRNLRHTFGSLLIRSGYSIDEACRLTRNSREVFTEHYGRILGLEMSVNITSGTKKAKIIEIKSAFTA